MCLGHVIQFRFQSDPHHLQTRFTSAFWRSRRSLTKSQSWWANSNLVSKGKVFICPSLVMTVQRLVSTPKPASGWLTSLATIMSNPLRANFSFALSKGSPISAAKPTKKASGRRCRNAIKMSAVGSNSKRSRFVSDRRNFVVATCFGVKSATAAAPTKTSSQSA